MRGKYTNHHNKYKMNKMTNKIKFNLGHPHQMSPKLFNKNNYLITMIMQLMLTMNYKT